jgi:hypothetical protein
MRGLYSRKETINANAFLSAIDSKQALLQGINNRFKTRLSLFGSVECKPLTKPIQSINIVVFRFRLLSSCLRFACYGLLPGNCFSRLFKNANIANREN